MSCQRSLSRGGGRKGHSKCYECSDENLSGKESIQFSSLTQRCSRKQAASRFYTCLLLAKEGMIDVKQEEPYADIAIQKGPKFTEVFLA